MPFEMLYQGGLLLAVAVTAFAISAVVGMLVAYRSAPPKPVGGPEDGRHPRHAWPDAPHDALRERRPSRTLAPVEDPVT
jgi:hypothetical protein